MQSLLATYDSVCFLKVAYRSKNLVIRNHFDRYVSDLESALTTTSESLMKLALLKLEDTFRTKLYAIELLETELPDLLHLSNEVSVAFGDYTHNKRYTNLSRNVQRALITTQAVVEAIMPLTKSASLQDAAATDISYHEMIASLHLAIPDSRVTSLMIDWIDASLQTDFLITASYLLMDKNIPVAEKRIQELSSAVVTASSAYEALAIELEVLKKPVQALSSKQSKAAKIFGKILQDKNEINEHLKKGGKLSELTQKFKIVKPLSITN